MNILFLNSIDHKTYGGMEEWIRLVATGLSGRGHKVIIAGREGSEFLRRVGKSDSRLELLPLRITGDFHPTTIAHLHRIMKQRRTDAVVANFNKDLRLGGLAARWNRETRVVWSVGLDITRDSWVHRWLTPRLADTVIVPSESLRDQIIRHGYIELESVNVIPIGLPDTTDLAGDAETSSHVRGKYGLPGDAILAVTASRFVEQKGHSYLLEAACTILKEHPNVWFLWLGSGPLEEQLRKWARDHDIQSHIVWAGMLDSVETELAASDLMIHPSIEEPFGIAILEGLRAGLPVVASRVGGIPEVVDEQCASLVTPRDIPALAGAVGELVSNVERRAQMGLHARSRFLSHFRVETMYDRIEDCLMRVVRMERQHG